MLTGEPREPRGSPVGKRRTKRDRERSQLGEILGVECSAVFLVRQRLMGFCNHEVCLRLTGSFQKKCTERKTNVRVRTQSWKVRVWYWNSNHLKTEMLTSPWNTLDSLSLLTQPAWQSVFRKSKNDYISKRFGDDLTRIEIVPSQRIV